MTMKVEGIADTVDEVIADSLLDESGPTKKIDAKVLKKKDSLKKEQLYLQRSSNQPPRAVKTSTPAPSKRRVVADTKEQQTTSEEDDDGEGGQEEVEPEIQMLEKFSGFLQSNVAPTTHSLNNLFKLNKILEDSHDEHYVSTMSNAISQHVASHNILHPLDFGSILTNNATEKVLISAKDLVNNLSRTIQEAKRDGLLAPEIEQLFSEYAPGLMSPITESIKTNVTLEEDESAPRPAKQSEMSMMNNQSISQNLAALSNFVDGGISPVFFEKFKELRLKQLKEEGKLTTEIIDAYGQLLPLRDLLNIMKQDIKYRLGKDSNIENLIRTVVNEHSVRGLAAENMKKQLLSESTGEEDKQGKNSFTVNSPVVSTANTEVMRRMIPEVQQMISEQIVNEEYAVQLNHFITARNKKSQKATDIYRATHDIIEAKRKAARTIGDVKDEGVSLFELPTMVRELVDKEDAEQERLKWLNHGVPADGIDREIFLAQDTFDSHEKLEENLSLLNNATTNLVTRNLQSKAHQIREEDNELSFLSHSEGLEEFGGSLLDSHVVVRKERFRKRLEEYEEYVAGREVQMPFIKDVESVSTVGKAGKFRIVAPIERYMDEYIDSVPPSLARERLINNIRAISTNPTLTIKEKQAVIRGLRDTYISNGLHLQQLTPENMPTKIYGGKRTHMHPNRVNPRDAAAHRYMMNKEALLAKYKDLTQKKQPEQQE